ncbi:MAG: futalosine hydrolase [Humidesulfovibrio sp.]|uniref:futalosine hydrolase n=1 Tax=Humidesulfovibrio sp. TaxID=2910988 RepID=UPI0027334443|nr:futalosine hydrolase [Humidesulfovibrio sp.]MDP2847829.1 futalosine hydrolase [Humidesulfovibrio sp.]
MPVLVVAATGMELGSALKVQVDAPQGRVFELSAFGRPVLALVTGIGVVNSALALGRALERRDVSGVLSLGVAGSFDLAAHPLGSVRLATEEIWPEFGLLPSGQCAADARGLGFSLNGVAVSDEAAIFERLVWDAHAGARAMGLNPAGLACAASLTVSGVTADPARARELFQRFGAGLENMEGFALAYAARLAGTPFAELRAVSNAVGARPPEAWDLPGALAALGRAAQQILAP